MKIENAVVLVTGANRGIGLTFARELLARGARKVCAGARDPATVTQAGVQALQLDVTKPDDVAAAAQRASDVTPKSSPEQIVRRALDGLESGLDEVLADELTQQVKRGMTAARPSYLPQSV